MFKLTRRPAAEPIPAPRIPDGSRVYAIGDVHGRLDLLDEMMTLIDREEAALGPTKTQIVFLGDLVDRGPYSAGVVERAMEITETRPTTRFVLGNHEEVMLQCLAGDERAMKLFRRIGGRETMINYGVPEFAIEALGDAELIERFDAVVPDHHRDFLATFEDMVVIGDYAFVHAGVRPGIAIEEQVPGDLRWIREPFISHADDLGKVVVHGHTITSSVDIRRNRIGVDTGAYWTGRLSALAIEGERRWTIATG